MANERVNSPSKTPVIQILNPKKVRVLLNLVGVLGE